MERRNLLKTMGGIGAAATVAGAGIGTLSGSAAAQSGVSITASNLDAGSNDRGDISQVTIDPDFTVNWDNFDDAVGKVFYLVEAKVGDGAWQPIFRATPWLSAEQIGTTGTYDQSSGLPLVIADEEGKPDYSSFNFDDLSGVDLESYLDGTSMQSSDNYVPGQPAPDAGDEVVVPASEPMQNNLPDADAGYYGAASDTEPFDSDVDGESNKANVQVRYTLELQRPNLSQLKYSIDYTQINGIDATSDPETTFASLPVDEQKTIAVEQIDGLKESDIDTGNSKIVMNGEDGNKKFGSNYANGTGISYDALQNNADNHVGIIVETAQFDVTIANEAATTSGSGTSGTGVTAPEK
jgi:hypothetical protein